MIRTAECVSPMHPDKMCDRISDTLLDFHLNQDPNSRCAIEVCGGNGKVFVTTHCTKPHFFVQKIPFLLINFLLKNIICFFLCFKKSNYIF